jgi:uncharacterized membrane-anchored protein
MLCIGKTRKILMVNGEWSMVIISPNYSLLTTHNSQIMNTELIGVIVTFLVTVLLAIPLGKYIAKVFSGEKTFMDFMNPVERFIYRVCGIDSNKGMNWKEFLKAMLTINLLWFVYGFFHAGVPGQIAAQSRWQSRSIAGPGL